MAAAAAAAASSTAKVAEHAPRPGDRCSPAEAVSARKHGGFPPGNDACSARYFQLTKRGAPSGSLQGGPAAEHGLKMKINCKTRGWGAVVAAGSCSSRLAGAALTLLLVACHRTAAQVRMQSMQVSHTPPNVCFRPPRRVAKLLFPYLPHCRHQHRRSVMLPLGLLAAPWRLSAPQPQRLPVQLLGLQPAQHLTITITTFLKMPAARQQHLEHQPCPGSCCSLTISRGTH